ncbi:MAG: hypothetical protein ABFC89_00405 [Methanospirillum sp.]
MRLTLIVLALLLAVLVAGCIDASPSATPTPTPSLARYSPGDLLRGDLVGAGFDEPNATPAGAAIVVLEYQPKADQYIYTLVQPPAEGWQYVYPSGDFVTRMGRDRTTFEAYRLERIGHVDLSAIRGPPNATAPHS